MQPMPFKSENSGWAVMSWQLEFVNFCSSHDVPIPTIEGTGVDINADALHFAIENENSIMKTNL